MARLAAATAALMALLAVLLAPPAMADDGSIVILQDGKIRCGLSPNNVDRGGGPIAVCELTNGQPWGMVPWETSKFNQRQNLAIVRGTGEMFWDRGVVTGSGSAGGMSIAEGQTYNVDGWTIAAEGFRTRITNDVSKHGILLNEGYVRQF